MPLPVPSHGRWVLTNLVLIGGAVCLVGGCARPYVGHRLPKRLQSMLPGEKNPQGKAAPGEDGTEAVAARQATRASWLANRDSKQSSAYPAVATAEKV